MATLLGIISHNAGRVRGAGFKIRIIRGTGLFLILVICLVMLSVINLRTASAAECLCVSCHGVNHHGDDWAACQTCHLSPPATGAHATHSAPLSNTTYGDTVTSTAGEYRFGCGHCHSLTVTTIAVHSQSRNATIQLSGSAGIGQSGEQICSDCHGSNGPHPASCDTNDCIACHTDKSMSSLAHPTGPSTPSSCTTCHTTQHVSAINIDVACGQCHGGSAGAAGTIKGAPYLSQETLIPYASVMHGGDAEGGPVSPDPVLPPVPGSCDSALKASGTLTGGVCATDGSDITTCSTTLGSTSTLTGPFANQAGNIYIDWGDGSAIETNPASPAAHTYAHIGKYQISQTVTNPCGYRARKHYIVNVTTGPSGNGKGTIAISADATYPFSYNVYYADDPSSITTASVPQGTTRNIILDVGNYDVKVTYPAGLTATSGTCAGSPVQMACKIDGDCPMNYSVSPAVHYSCSKTSTTRSCDWAINAPGTGTCTADGCQDVVVPANTIVKMAGTNCND